MKRWEGKPVNWTAQIPRSSTRRSSGDSGRKRHSNKKEKEEPIPNDSMTGQGSAENTRTCLPLKESYPAPQVRPKNAQVDTRLTFDINCPFLDSPRSSPAYICPCPPNPPSSPFDSPYNIASGLLDSRPGHAEPPRVRDLRFKVADCFPMKLLAVSFVPNREYEHLPGRKLDCSL